MTASPLPLPSGATSVKASSSGATSALTFLLQMSSVSAQEGSLFADLGKHEIFTPTKDLSADDGERTRCLAVGGNTNGSHMRRRRALRCAGVTRTFSPVSPIFPTTRCSRRPSSRTGCSTRLPKPGRRTMAEQTSGRIVRLDSLTRSRSPVCSCARSPAGLRRLATEIPDLQKRVDHILTKQVFGIGITYLTSLLARRSVYCSKHANGPLYRQRLSQRRR